MDSDLVQVRHVVQRTVGTLSSSRDGTEISESLQTMRNYLDETKNPPSVKEKEEFIKNHYATFLRCLVSKLSPDWLEQIQSDKGDELWSSFFLEGPADQSFMVLLDSIISIPPSFRLNKVVDVLERFLQSAGLSALMWEVCKQQTQAAHLVLQEGILSKVVCLPDHLSNKLQRENRPVFFPQNYFPLLGTEIVRVMEKVFDSLRGGLDCSISFVSQVLGKVCIHGRQREVLGALVPCLADRTQSDCIWQRMCWRLVEDVPDRWMEAVALGFVQSAPGPAVLSRLLGNLVVKNKKAQFVMTQKLLLLQFGHPTAVLQNLLGYLALDSTRRPLLVGVLKELLGTWSSSSAVKHSPAEQQLYLSKAIMICLSRLKDSEIMSNKAELLTSMMEGMKCHLDSNSPRIRHMGMVVAECLSARIMPEGPPLKFQYEDDEEIRELKSLLIEEPEQTAVCDSPSGNSIPAERPSMGLGPTIDPPAPASEEPRQGGDSDLDSDDDLVPCDMSGDKELEKVKAPTYLQDCIEILTGPEDTDKCEAAMNTLELLIRRNASAAKEVSVELAKLLLHLEEKSYIEGFGVLRQRALVSIAVTDPVPVTQYLTSEFYSLNYSLRQRMDILDALALAAQELARPLLPTAKQPASPQSPRIQILSSNKPSPDWRKVVDERIQKKTRKFAKGQAQSEPLSSPNRFGPVAGYFFFPLLRDFDRPLTTFDLLGDDHLVLGRLAHTLAVLLYFAVGTAVAPVMGKALLEFAWALRFHTDMYVRQGLLSCVSSLLLSVPAERLLDDMTEEILETRAWLTDVVEKDPSGECRSLALQNLLLLESLKKNLESPLF